MLVITTKTQHQWRKPCIDLSMAWLTYRRKMELLVGAAQRRKPTTHRSL